MPSTTSLPERIRNALRDYDLLSAGLLVLERLARRARIPLAIHTYALVAQPVRPPAIPARRRRRFETRFLERLAPELEALPRPSSVIESRFDQGAHCLGIFRDERLIGCAWLCLGPYLEDEVRCRFEPHPTGRTAWDFDVFLHEDFRVGFAFASLWAAVNEWLAGEGAQWTMSRISTLNPASIRAHRRLGAVTLGRAIYFSLGTFQLMVSSLRPWVHLGWSTASIPHLILFAPSEETGSSSEMA